LRPAGFFDSCIGQGLPFSLQPPWTRGGFDSEWPRRSSWDPPWPFPWFSAYFLRSLATVLFSRLSPTGGGGFRSGGSVIPLAATVPPQVPSPPASGKLLGTLSAFLLYFFFFPGSENPRIKRSFLRVVVPWVYSYLLSLSLRGAQKFPFNFLPVPFGPPPSARPGRPLLGIVVYTWWYGGKKNLLGPL